MLPDDIAASPHFTVPGLEVQREGDRVTLINHVLGTQLQGPARLLRILDFFRAPTPLRAIVAADVAPLEEILPLIEHGMILDLRIALQPAEFPIGEALGVESLWDADLRPDLVVLGAPTDAATTEGAGARQGPGLIRGGFSSLQWGSGAPPEAQLLDLEMRRCYRGRPRVLDLGDLRRIPGESMQTYGARLRLLTDAVLAQGGRPVLLGGDHSITHFSLQAVLDRFPAVGIIHFDAHHDTWPPFAPNIQYVAHNNPFLGALRDERLKHLLQIGLRTVELVDPEKVYADPRVHFVSGMEAERLPVEQIFAGLPPDLPWYLTFDIDCLSPELAPDTGSPLPGGLSYYRALELVDHAARRYRIVGADFVEVSGAGNHRTNGTASVAARLMGQLMLGTTPFEPLKSYLRHA